jgi:hypothetical protein
MIRKVLAGLTLVLLAQGCATSIPAAGDEGNAGRTSRGRENLITGEELADHPEFASVAEAVQRLRPRWREATVYVNDTQYYGTSRDIQLYNVKELRYLSLSEAQMTWGQSISTAVIQVITR